jgi:hypothetical protein
MSNSLAIAAVTATLRNLIFQGTNADLSGTDVTTRPLDRARANLTGNQVNLFLYHTALDAAWSNREVPWQVRPGETGHPALPLTLYYLVTAFGANDDDTVAHRLLGRAMSVLHDHPVLGAEEIRVAFPNNDLYLQVERVRVTEQPLSVDEMYKLWTAFQTQYRISAAYQAAVVLIDSTLPTRTPLPVLTRGPNDRGPVAQSTTIPPIPTLESLTIPDRQLPAALLSPRVDNTIPNPLANALPGDKITLSGHDLAGTAIVVRFSHPLLATPIPVTPLAGSATATAITVTIPNNPPPNNLPAGVCTVAVVVSRTGAADYTTNELPLPLAPQLTNLPIPPIVRDANGNATVNVQCTPQILPDQRVYFILGDRQILAAPHPTPTTNLSFLIRAADPGAYLVRLRVDGVDSLLLIQKTIPPTFDPSQTVTIQ